MERRYHLLLWTFFLLMNGVYGQENVDNGLNMEYEIVDEPAVINQNVTECPGSVHSYLVNTTRSLFQSEIMPEIEQELDQKDQEIIRMNDTINEMKTLNIEMKVQFEDQLTRKDEKIGDLEERFEGVEDQLRRKDEVINDLTTTVNEMKTKLQALNMPKVIFNAQKTDGGDEFNGNITFNDVTLNVGKGMSSDGFVAPIDGHYRLSFSAIGTMNKYELSTWVKVYKNEVMAMYIGDSNECKKSDGNNISHNWIWKLNKGDTVSFEVNSESYLRSFLTEPVNFNGELVFVET